MARLFKPRKDRREPDKKIVVFYHADCTDGFTAAWAAWKKLGNKAKYIAQINGEEPPVLQNKRIYTLDITFSEPTTKRLMKDNQLSSIDHHISNKDVTLSTYQPSYALNNSGCVLAWKYFHPGKTVPKLLLYVEDVDLWKNKIKNSHHLYGYIDLLNFKFSVWSKLIRDFEIPVKFKKILETGGLIARHDSMMIDYDISKNAKLVKFAGYSVYAINSTQSASGTGARLTRLQPPFAIVWKEFKDGVGVSLRGDGNVDCSEIAAKYGGGGHRNSAAFRLNSLKDIPWKAIKNAK